MCCPNCYENLPVPPSFDCQDCGAFLPRFKKPTFINIAANQDKVNTFLPWTSQYERIGEPT